MTPSTFSPYWIAIADLNGDGFPDAVVSGSLLHGVAVLLNTGDGSFVVHQVLSIGNTPSGLAVADFDGDGINDLAIAISSTDKVAVLLGNGDGSFQPPRDFFGVGQVHGMVAVADLNGDGRPDMAVVTAQASDGVSLLIDNTAQKSAPSCLGPRSPRADSK